MIVLFPPVVAEVALRTRAAYLKGLDFNHGATEERRFVFLRSVMSLRGPGGNPD